MKNITKEDYDDIINYMFKYISNKKSKWYFTKKIKRCLYDNYINNFSISFITNLSEEDWNAWIELLDKIINENNLKDNNEDISSEDKTSNNNNTNNDKNILNVNMIFVIIIKNVNVLLRYVVIVNFININV